MHCFERLPTNANDYDLLTNHISILVYFILLDMLAPLITKQNIIFYILRQKQLGIYKRDKLITTLHFIQIILMYSFDQLISYYI